jgi:paraquat-inducible protein B
MSASTTNRWKLGLFVTLSVTLTVAVLLWLGISQLQRSTIPAYFHFAESVNGLEIGSPVKFRGVEIGRVEEIFPAPDQRHIEVRAGIYRDTLEAWGIEPDQRGRERTFVPEDLRGQLVTSALTSISFIQIDVFPVAAHPIPEYSFPIPWETIHTVPSTFKSLETGIMEALEGWPEISRRTASVLERLDEGLAEVDFPALNREAVALLESSDELMESLRTSPLVDRSSRTYQELDGTLGELRLLLQQLRGQEGDVHRLVTSVSGAAEAFREDFAGSDLPAAVSAMEAAGRGFEETSLQITVLVRELQTTIRALDQTLGSVGAVADLLARDPAALLYGRTARQPIQPR